MQSSLGREEEESREGRRATGQQPRQVTFSARSFQGQVVWACLWAEERDSMRKEPMKMGCG